MSRKYKFHNPDGVYFVSFAVVDWIDVFSSRAYINILLETLEFCQKHKGMKIYAWCVMPNHVHLVFRSMVDQKPELLLGDFKRFTSQNIVSAIKQDPHETRKDFFLTKFSIAASKSSNVKHLQFWQHDNRPIELWSKNVVDQKINYIHNNPVTAGLVSRPEDYLFGSASDYIDQIGLLKDVVVILK